VAKGAAVSIIPISKKLSANVDKLSFALPVTHYYNPLDYAWAPHAEYLKRYGSSKKDVVLVGMNPGPFGMAQTGVPFGDIKMVRDWLGIEEPVQSVKNEHPKRPIQGFSCPRSEVSGTRLWGWAKNKYKTPDKFFKRFFVWNYCPLSFMAESGKNLTPDKLPKKERDKLFQFCDQAFAELVKVLEPEFVIGVGDFAAKRAEAALEDLYGKVIIGRIPHPSPANPTANRNWAGAAEKAFKEIGVNL